MTSNFKKAVLYLLLLIITAIIVFVAWYAFIFFPDDYKITREEAGKTSKDSGSQVIALSLIDLLDGAVLQGYQSEKIYKLLNTLKDNNYLIKDDPFITGSRRNLVFRAGTGYPGIWVDERSSIIIPDKAAISFDVNLNSSPVLEFSFLSMLSGGMVNIEVSSANGHKIKKSISVQKYNAKYSSNDISRKLSNKGYKNAAADPGWRDFKTDIAQFANTRARISISFKTDSDGAAFIANPRIFRSAEKRRYNVIYLVFDGVSTRHFSFYNKRSNLTPYMKEIADKDFVVFDNLYSLGNKTRIAIAGLFSSALPYNTRHGINRNYIPEPEKENYYKMIREGSLASLPDIYRKKGYISQQFGNSGFTVHLLTTGVDYGFERSFEFSYNPYDSYGLSHNLFDFLRSNKNREFFLYLHYNTPHKPFYAPAKYFLKGIIDSPLECLWRPDFMGCISYTDDVFKNIYHALKTNNLLENTILVVATDHGAGYDLKKYDRGFLYNDYTRLAFMMRLPEKLKDENNIKKKRVDTYISSINAAPTLLELSGVDRPGAFRGRSFLNVLNNKFRNKFFDNEIWCFDRKAASFITDDMYKYIITFPDGKKLAQKKYILFGDQKEIPYEELYDLSSDQEETRNLVYERPLLLKKFRNAFLKKDIHHPERTVLSFFPHENKNINIEVELTSKSKLMAASLYSASLDKKHELKIHTTGELTRFSFKMKDNPLYLVFENENDRIPLSILIKSNGSLLNKDRIYSTSMNLNIYQNPIVLRDKEDFILLNYTYLPGKEEIPDKKKGLSVKIARIDLHRWIDIGKLESAGISAGMKETLKSWGYIQ